MSATRVRVCFEFRNGDGNYLRKSFAPHGFVACDGEYDLRAMEAAFLVALQHQAKSAEDIQQMLANRAPGHD